MNFEFNFEEDNDSLDSNLILDFSTKNVVKGK